MKRPIGLLVSAVLVILTITCSRAVSHADDTIAKDQTTQDTATAPTTAQDNPVKTTTQNIAALPDSTTNLYADSNPYSPVPPVSGPDQYSSGDESSGSEQNSMVKIRGNYGLSMGFTSDKFLWKMANGDWQEKNWRYFSGDQDVNTYDPRIFDRYELEVETDTKTPWNGYCDIVMDPWSFLQVGHERLYNNAKDNYVDVDYKGWQNTGYTINQSLRTASGQTIFIPEQKIIGNQISQFSGTPVFETAARDTFVFSPGRSVDMDYIFRPVRKLWLEYNESPFYLKMFPISDQAEALTSDDPFTLSNNHVYWAPSPWLWRFDPGIVFDQTARRAAGLRPMGEQPAMWNWDEAWFAEDSNRHYLTFLRGVSAGWNVEDFASLNITGATPLGLWDTYETVTSVPIAARFKMNPSEKLTVGSTYTSKYGIAKQQLRAQNHVLAGDVTYNIWDKTDVFGELAGSLLNVEHADHQISKDTGEAYKIGARSRIDFNEENSLKSDTYLAYMSPDFSPGLSDYRDTREDRDWGRHIWFDPLSAEDQASRIGDGIDVNRYTVGANARARIADNFFDVFLNWRNIHSAVENNKFIENTTRGEVTCNLTGRVQLKGLALFRKYHDTLGGYDPTLRDRYTDQLYISQSTMAVAFPKTLGGSVEDGVDVDVRTYSAGMKVDVIPEKVIVYGIYEATNDPQDFPRQILNNPYSSGPGARTVLAPFNNIPVNTVSTDYTHDNITFNQIDEALYGQSLFNMPPYNDYFSMWKACITVRPVKELQIRYTHVTNTNENYAALFDNNHTHDEIVVVHNPFKGVTWTTGCSISRVIDLARAIDTSSLATFPNATISAVDRQYKQHTNVYSQLNWDFRKDQRLTFQFGESWFLTQGGDVFSPQWFSQTSSVLDTRAIFRIWYQGKFRRS